MKEQISKLLAKGSLESREEFVRSSLNVLEVHFRKMCLLLLGEIASNNIHIRSMISEIAGLQRPSWGCWNGFMLGLLKERRRILNAGTQEQREAVGKSEGLSWAAGFMEENIEIKDNSLLDIFERLGCLNHSKNRRNNLKVRELLSLPIYIRNRMAHDNIADNQWWTDAGIILNFLLNWYLHSGILDHTEKPGFNEPWLIEKDGVLWCYNGINIKGEDSIVYYVSLTGSSMVDYGRSGSVILGFRRILGEEALQEANFKKLLNKNIPDELKGFLLGGYIVGEKTGEGGFAEVFKGTQLSTGRKVALKILKPGLSEADKLRFLHEAEYLSMFDHPNIAKIYEQNEQPWRKSQIYDLSEEKWFSDFKKNHGDILTYIAMEWIEGSTLDDLFLIITSGKAGYSEKEIAQWFAEAAEALEVIHNSNLIHRDISPKNIMVTDKGLIKLMDFGISRTQFGNRTAMTSHGKILGSEPYMSPEQLDYERAKSELGPRSDIYSLGSTFYELFTGTRIYNHDFTAVSIATASDRKRNGEKPKAPKVIKTNISWEISTILMGCLELDQGDRYKSARKLKEDIERFMKDLPIEYKRPSVSRRLKLLYKRNRRVINISTAFAILIILSTAYYIVSIQNANTKLMNANNVIELKNKDLEDKSKEIELINKDLQKKNDEIENSYSELKLANDKVEQANKDLQDQIILTRLQEKKANDNADEAERFARLSQENAERAIKQRDIAMGMIKKLTYDVAPKLYNIPNVKPILSEIMVWNTSNINKMLTLEPQSAEGLKAKIINYYLIGDIWKLLGDYDKSTEAYKNGHIIAKSLSENKNNLEAMLLTATGYNYTAYMELMAKDLDKAEKTCSEGIKIARELVEYNSLKQKNNDQALQQLGACYDYLGLIYMQKGQNISAEKIFEEELNIRKEQLAGNNNILVKGELASVYCNLGQVKQSLFKFNDALSCFEKELNICKELLDIKFTPEVKSNLEKIYIDLPFLTSYALDAIPYDIAVAYNNMGSIYWSMGDAEKSRNYFERSKDVYLELANDNSNIKAQNDLIVSYINLAYIYENENNKKEALSIYQNVLDIRKRIAADKSNLQAQYDLADCYKKIGELKSGLMDYSGALEAYEAQLELNRKFTKAANDIKAQKRLGDNLFTIGTLKESIADYTGALKAHEEALGIYLHTAVSTSYTDSVYEVQLQYELIARIHMYQKEYSEAIETYNHKVQFLSELAKTKPEETYYYDEYMAESYMNIGKIRNSISDNKGALEAYLVELELREKIVQNKAEQKRLDDLTKSLAGDVAISSGEIKLGYLCDTYRRIGYVKWEMGDTDGALEAYSAGFDIDKDLADNKKNIDAQKKYVLLCNDIGYILIQKGLFDNAYDMLTNGKSKYTQLTVGQIESTYTYDLYFYAAFAEEAVGEYETAEDDLKICLNILEQMDKSDSISNQKALIYNRYASIALRNHRYEDAIEHCKKALEQSNDNNYQLVSKIRMSIAYALNGNYYEAEALINSIKDNYVNIMVYSNISTPKIRINSKAIAIFYDMVEDLQQSGASNGKLQKLYKEYE